MKTIRLLLIFLLGAGALLLSRPLFSALEGQAGDLLYKEVKFVAGKDGQWFTRDDAVYDYTIYAYDRSGRLVKKKSYNTSKNSSAPPPESRLKEYWVYTYDVDGRMVRETYYSGKGADNRWFTAHDVETYHTDCVFDALGRKTRAIKDTTDGAVHYIKFEYDPQGRMVKDIEYRNPGLDGAWFTADDEIEKYHLYEYDSQGRVTRASECHADQSGRGPDGQWFSADDVISSAKECLYDQNGVQRLTRKYTGKGPDNMWFTDDDVVQYYIRYYYTSAKP